MIELIKLKENENLGCQKCGNKASLAIVSEFRNDENRYERRYIDICERCKHILVHDLSHFVSE